MRTSNEIHRERISPQTDELLRNLIGTLARNQAIRNENHDENAEPRSLLIHLERNLETLIEAGFSPDSVRAALGAGSIERLEHSYSSIFLERRDILRGHLDLRHTRPLISEERTPVLYFVVRPVAGGNLLRENQMGYHYHYSEKSTSRRSDIVITLSREEGYGSRPAVWEPHAVNKADFPAKVDQWGKEKRDSVHAVCVRDRQKLKLENFRRPGMGALKLP